MSILATTFCLFLIAFTFFEIVDFSYETSFKKLASCEITREFKKTDFYLKTENLKNSTSPFVYKYFTKNEFDEFQNLSRKVSFSDCNAESSEKLSLFLFEIAKKYMHASSLFVAQKDTIKDINHLIKKIQAIQLKTKAGSEIEAQYHDDLKKLCSLKKQYENFEDYFSHGNQCRQPASAKLARKCIKSIPYNKGKEIYLQNLTFFKEKWTKFIDFAEPNEACNKI